MKLTTEQLDLISKEIITGGIKYQDLYEELLDHYITAIEDRIKLGTGFEEALREVHSGFEKHHYPVSFLYYYDNRRFKTVQKPNYGLVKLQDEYKERLNKEISKRHWQIIRNYFRWPMLLTTLFVGLLTFQFSSLVPRHYFAWAMTSFVLFPLFMVLPQAGKQLWNYFGGKHKFVNSLKTNAIYSRLGLLFAFVSVTLNLPTAFFDYHIFKQGSPVVIACLLCFYIAYSLSFYQLYRERFKVHAA